MIRSADEVYEANRLPADVLGNLVRFELRDEHWFDPIGVEPLLHEIDFVGLVAQPGFRRRHHHRHLEASATYQTAGACGTSSTCFLCKPQESSAAVLP